MNVNEALNLLNLSGKVTKEEITKAYKKMAIKYHPDRNPAGIEVMKAINAAYEFLKSLNSDTIEHTDTKNAYDFSVELSEIIVAVQKMKGVVMEICGNWIWLSGSTKEHKEALKELGFKWASKKKMWYFRPEEHRSRKRSKTWEMDEIREKFGSVIKKSEQKQLKA
ncbi:J domain-containing protein [Pasteurella multocida]|uniref:J domain-containing protein n=1 Tax=Pasteurella multocida TaxID=747 RepID=UPI002FE0B21F